MFDVPTTVYSSLNIMQPINYHWIMQGSYVLSWIYLLLHALSVPLVVFISNRSLGLLTNKEYRFKWGILYRSFKLDPTIRKLFRAFSLSRFILFSMNLVFSYYLPLFQIAGGLILSMTYLILLMIKQPFQLKFDFTMEFALEFALSVGNIFFFILALDEVSNIFEVNTRIEVGWIIICMTLIILIVTIIPVLYTSIQYFILLGNQAKDKFSSNDRSQLKRRTHTVAGHGQRTTERPLTRDTTV